MTRRHFWELLRVAVLVAAFLILTMLRHDAGPLRLTLQPVSFDQLQGWSDDRIAAAIPAFVKSCGRVAARTDATPLDTRFPTVTFGRVGDWRGEGRIRLRHPGEAEIGRAPRQRHRYRPDPEAEDEAIAIRTDGARARQRERAANRRVARHQQLITRREDAHAHVGARSLGRQDERRLGKIHLVGDGLHRVRGEATAVEEHGQLIAAEQVVSKDVVVQVAV